MFQAKAGGFPKLTYVDKDITVEDMNLKITELEEKFAKMLVYAQFLEKKIEDAPHAPANWFDGCHIVQYHVDGKCTVIPCLGCTCWKKNINIEGK